MGERADGVFAETAARPAYRPWGFRAARAGRRKGAASRD